MLSSHLRQSEDAQVDNTQLVLIPGVPQFLDRWLSVPGDRKEVSVKITAPSNISAKLRVARWGYQRADGASERLLKAVAEDLFSFDGTVAMKGTIPRRLQLELTASDNASARTGSVLLTVRTERETYSKQIEFEILPIRLPNLDRSIGIFLARPPAYTWFPTVAKTLDDILVCDLETLASLGLNAAAPAITPPYSGRQAPFQKDVERARRILPGDLIDYVTLKSMNEGNPEKLASHLHNASSALVARGLKPPVWSLADEPDPSREAFKQYRSLAAVIRKTDKKARLAALNAALSLLN